MPRILVVEDDPPQAARLQKTLSGRGFEVEVVSDGRSAVERIRASTPDLVVLDAVLPKLSGFHVARLVKFDERVKKVPILMLTVLNQAADRERGKQVGVDLYLTKPFGDEQLLDAVKQLVLR